MDEIDINGMFVLSKPKYFYGVIGDWIYSFLFPLVYYRVLKNISIFKSNQLLGAWGLVISKLLLKKPFLLRTGYTLSLFLRKNGCKNFKLRIFELLEKLTFYFSDHATCASLQDQKYLLEKYPFLNNANLTVQKNYIDVNKYKCATQFLKREDRIVFIGRFNFQKNILAMLRAYKSSQVDLDLHIIGCGELEEKIIDEINTLNLNDRVHLRGKLSNDRVARELKLSKYFILPSLFEGMPKSLLEAMASGCVCIATNVQGNNEVILHEENGFLALDSSKEAIENALKKYLSNYDPKFEDISSNAASYIEKFHSLESYVESEIEVLRNACT